MADKPTGKDTGYFMQMAGKAATTMKALNVQVSKAGTYFDNLRKGMKKLSGETNIGRRVMSKLSRVTTKLTDFQQKAVMVLRDRVSAQGQHESKLKKIIRLTKDRIRGIKGEGKELKTLVKLQGAEIIQNAARAASESGLTDAILSITESQAQLNSILKKSPEEFTKIQKKMAIISEDALKMRINLDPVKLNKQWIELHTQGLTGTTEEMLAMTEAAAIASAGIDMSADASATMARTMKKTIGQTDDQVKTLYDSLAIARTEYGMLGDEGVAAIENIGTSTGLMVKSGQMASKAATRLLQEGIAVQGLLKTEANLGSESAQIQKMLIEASSGDQEAHAKLNVLMGASNTYKAEALIKDGKLAEAMAITTKGAAHQVEIFKRNKMALRSQAEAAGFDYEIITKLALAEGRLSKRYEEISPLMAEATSDMNNVKDSAGILGGSLVNLGERWKSMMTSKIVKYGAEGFTQIGSLVFTLVSQIAPLLIALKAVGFKYSWLNVKLKKMVPTTKNLGKAFKWLGATASRALGIVVTGLRTVMMSFLALGGPVIAVIAVITAAIAGIFFYSKYKKQIDAWTAKTWAKIIEFKDKIKVWMGKAPGFIEKWVPILLKKWVSLAPTFISLGFKAVLKALTFQFTVLLPFAFKMLWAAIKGVGTAISDQMWPSFTKWIENVFKRIAAKVKKELMIVGKFIGEDTLLGSALRKLGIIGDDEKPKSNVGKGKVSKKELTQVKGLKLDVSSESTDEAVIDMKDTMANRMDHLIALQERANTLAGKRTGSNAEAVY